MTAAMTGQMGTVYLLHFSEPYKHAAHYLGWASNLDGRLHHHQCGSGARLLAVAKAAGITWDLVATWRGDRNFERQVKRNGGLSRCCPVCSENPRFKDGATYVG